MMKWSSHQGAIKILTLEESIIIASIPGRQKFSKDATDIKNMLGLPWWRSG